MFNTIFMLLNIISKLLEKEIVSKSCNGYKKDDEKCQNCQYGSGIIGFFICIIKKYPIVFLFDIVCIMLFLGVTIIYYLDIYNLLSKFSNETIRFFLKR
ncbi:Uncharacterised protein [Clostridium novyi]|nr:Uncharacterised protein [Clostridium novyi]